MEPNRHMDIKKVADKGNSTWRRDTQVEQSKSFRTLEIGAVTLAVVLVGAFFYFHPSFPVGGQPIAADVKVDTPATYTEPMTLTSSGKTFSISALGANAAQAVTVGAVTKYTDAFTNTDVTETKQSDRIKEDIILKQPGHPATFAYQIDVAPYDVVKDGQGSLVFYMKGHSGDSNFWRFEIPAPSMTDAKGKKSTVSDVESTLTSDGTLTVRPSAAWLASAAYPVDLDPTIIFFRAGIPAAPPAPDTTTYIEDVFSAYTYTGNGSTQTITNGVDLAGKGGMVWAKDRTNAYHNVFTDTTRGLGMELYSDGTAASVVTGDITSFNSTGYSLGYNSQYQNIPSAKDISWSFAQAPKFFKVAQVTVAGGVDATVDLSSLGTVGMVTVKRTDSTSAWYTWHRSLTAGDLVYLNTTAAQTADTSISVSGTTLTLKGGTIANGTYIVYAWAHDTGTDGLIQCGSFNPASAIDITLGWEPQFLIFKSAASTGNWYMFDTSRVWSLTEAMYLYSNTAGTDTSFPTNTGYSLTPTASGFRSSGPWTGGTNAVYCAIRRGPMKAPTSGTQVYFGKLQAAGAGLITGIGFPPDLLIGAERPANGALYPRVVWDRLRGAPQALNTSGTTAETNPGAGRDLLSFDMDGVTGGSAWNTNFFGGTPNVGWFFRRYPGVFDEVAYTGTGSAKTVAHNLTVVPELMIVKDRSSAQNWMTYSVTLGASDYLNLNNAGSGGNVFSGAWNSTAPTSSIFTVGTYGGVNLNGDNYVSYLFATKAGISKVGSYTGNGSSLTLNAGFTGGAKFILIKRTDSTGDWFVWDSTRGIVAGNDPHLSLNTTVAEVTTDDSVDPDNSGFIVNQVAATNINVNAATYIYLAFSGDTLSTPYTPPTPTVPTIFRSKQTVVTPGVGQQAYTTAGTYSWTAPAGVTSVSVVTVGGGGGGFTNADGGGGGGLGYLNNYTVIPGNSYTVVVGTGGAGGAPGVAGGDSYFVGTATVKGGGGGGGVFSGGGASGGHVGTGGGNGGAGGAMVSGYEGGGGAGGYAGTGGAGGSDAGGLAGNGGGAGGGGGYPQGAGGGGVGILGQGTSGGVSGGGGAGQGGSGGANSPGNGSGAGAVYGGGGGGISAATAGVGAVRIIWGPNRSFPSTNTADQTSVGGVLSTNTPTIFRIPPPPHGQQAYTTGTATGDITFSWVAPAGVTSVSVVAVGYGYSSGGGLGYKNNIPVTPGQSYTVVVSGLNGTAAGSYFINTTTVMGGRGADGVAGTHVGDSGGNGGVGNRPWGAGGAGGYSGNGGNGATEGAGGNGLGGGGGGGASTMGINCGGGAGGGGVGVLGQGASGTGGVYGGNDGCSQGGGGGGSGGGSAGSGSNGGGSSGGVYGGGPTAGSGPTQNSGGAVRIIWPGTTRGFPSTNTGDM